MLFIVIPPGAVPMSVAPPSLGSPGRLRSNLTTRVGFPKFMDRGASVSGAMGAALAGTGGRRLARQLLLLGTDFDTDRSSLAPFAKRRRRILRVGVHPASLGLTSRTFVTSWETDARGGARVDVRRPSRARGHRAQSTIGARKAPKTR
jgi:hypothetical protein